VPVTEFNNLCIDSKFHSESREIFLTLAKLKKLCVKNRENIVDYIDRAQMVYNNVIEAEKSERELFTNSNIARINGRFVHAFS